jgi:hypothetical protein
MLWRAEQALHDIHKVLLLIAGLPGELALGSLVAQCQPEPAMINSSNTTDPDSFTVVTSDCWQLCGIQISISPTLVFHPSCLRLEKFVAVEDRNPPACRIGMPGLIRSG